MRKKPASAIKVTRALGNARRIERPGYQSAEIKNEARNVAHEPKPDKDGIRRYNKWSGNPQGHREDVTLCIAEVWPNGRAGFARAGQCARKRGHGPGGLYCKQHDPEAVKRRDEESRERYERKMRQLNRPSRLLEAYRAALQSIVDGHNDPRSVAAEALKTE